MLEKIAIVPGRGDEPDILTRFREAAGRWVRGNKGGANDTVMLACDLLVENFDTPSLRDLASLPSDAGWWDSREVLKSTVEELGLDFLTLEGEQSRLLTLQFLCRAFLVGNLAPLEFLSASRYLFEGSPPEIARELAYLIYAFDADERELDAAESAQLTALAEKDARVFLAANAQG